MNDETNILNIIRDINKNKHLLREYDDETVIKIISFDGSFFPYAKEQIRHNIEYLKLALSTYGAALMNVKPEYQDDKELALLACKQYCNILLFLSKRLRADKDVILCAVAQNGTLLLYASNDLKNDKEVVITAISNNWKAFYHINSDLRIDIDILIVIIVKYRDVPVFMPSKRFYPYYNNMKIIKESVIEFLIRSRAIKRNTNILVKLNTHGIHYGFLIKQHIINYLIPSNLWNIAIRPRDRNGFMWEILDKALIYIH